MSLSSIILQEITDIKRKLRFKFDDKDVLTFDEACLYMGKSRSALYHLTAEKKIKHSKPGGKEINFKLKDIKAYMLSNPVEVTEEQSISYLENNPLKKSA